MVFCKLRKRLTDKQKSIRHTTNNQGFTLIELLIALFVSGFIFSGLISMVVSFLNIDRRESRLDQLQQDVQRASDFITDDLREAIFVYNDPAFLTQLAPYMNASTTPVLALWRPVPIEDADELANIEFTTPATCATTYTTTTNNEGDSNSDICELLKARRASYSFVIYGHRDNDPATENWDGPARIERYELSKYVDLATGPNANTFDVRDGYPDLTDPNDTTSFNNFEGWTPATTVTSPPTSQTLVDKIGFNYSVAAASGAIVDCDAITGSTPPGPYNLFPANATTDSSFYACVRDTTPSATVNANNTNVRASQDIYLVVQGDARSGITAADRGDSQAKATSDLPLNGANELSRFPQVESLTLVGGGINRDG